MARTKVDDKLNVVIGTKAQVEADNTIPDNSIVIVTDEELTASDIPNLDAGKITTGTFGVDRIPPLPQSKITDLVTDLGNKVVKNESITPATKAKITYDAKGLVTAGADLIADDIPELAQSKITNLSADLENKADKRPAQKTITTATTLALTDEGKVILANGTLKITIPLNSSVLFPIDTEIAIVRYGTGEVTIGTASGATLNGESSTTTFTLGDQYSSVALKKISTDAWLIIGNFT